MAQYQYDEVNQIPRPLMRGGMIDLGVLFAVIGRSRNFFILGLAVAVLLSIVYLHIAPRKYSVSMEIMPTSSPARSLPSGGLGALASVAGISLGEGGDSQFRVFLDSLQSPVAAEALAGRQDLLREMFPREWSDSEKRWREPPSLTRPVTHAIERVLGLTVVPWTPPSKNKVYDYLQQQLKVIQDQKRGVVTLQMDNADPAVAVRILAAVNSAVDNLMRQRALTHTAIYIGYLTKELSTVTVAEYRNALVDQLAEQEKTRMMASGPVPFVSEVLGSPLVSSAPVSPSPITTLAVGIILGLLLGTLLAILAERRGWSLEFSLFSGRLRQRSYASEERREMPH